MEARIVPALPQGAGWMYEPKWDGFRCIADKENGKVQLTSKSGKPLNRYFPDVVEMLENLSPPCFILDGEIVIARGDDYSFSDLQLRLHPAASRVRKLAAENPATYIAFDLLMSPDGKNTKSLPFARRRALLEKFFKNKAGENARLILSPQTGDDETAQSWLDSFRGRVDGIVAKNADDIYVPGERIMQKYKPLRTADCVVGGFRYGSDSPYVGSLLLGLYDDQGLLHHIGFTTTISRADKPALTKKLESLIAPPGFTGSAPGGPSRWSTERSGQWQPLKPVLVVEVSYDHVTDNRFRHGTKLIRWRPDKSPEQCRFEQIGVSSDKTRSQHEIKIEN